MKTFTNTCAQGDIYIQRVADDTEIPAGATRVPVELNGDLIVTHSETGHHHVIDGELATMYRLPESITDCLLVVSQPTALRHLRQHDTHDPIAFEAGTYKVRRQREYLPEGFRLVQD